MWLHLFSRKELSGQQISEINTHCLHTKCFALVSIGCSHRRLRAGETKMKAKILAAMIASNLLALQSSFAQRAVAVPAELEPQIKQLFTVKQAQARALV